MQLPARRPAAIALRWAWRRLATDRHGAATLEFAFLGPVLVLLLFGVIELSRFHYLQGTVQTATAAVLRQATIDQTLGEAAARALFIDEALGVDPARLATFSLARTQEGGTTLQRITIRVRVDFQSLLPVLFAGAVPIEAEREGFAVG